MNVIQYDNFTFDDTSIISGKLNLANALAFDSLVPDEMTVDVWSTDTGAKKLLTVGLDWYSTVDNRGYVVGSGDIRNYTYGDPVEYYYDNNLVGKFYMRNVTRTGENTFRLTMFSAVGLWTGFQHMGGIYEGGAASGTPDTAGKVIASILNGVTYTIDNDVASALLYGYLPIASARDNLMQVLFALGASIVKDANGNPRIAYLKNLTPVTIPDSRIFIGGKVDYRTPATEIEIVEHSYYKSSLDIEESLFDNTDGLTGSATNKLVTFSEPCYDFKWNGSAIPGSWANGANYCYVTGTGVLSGKKYTHTTKPFTVSTGVNAQRNQKSVKEGTLVSAVNSANVAARLVDYYGASEDVGAGIVLIDNTIKTGTLVSFNDPYGDATTGIVEKMDLTMSGNLKAECSVIKNYIPSHFGNNFTQSRLFTSNGTWTVPSGTNTVRIVLGSGGQAGQNGDNGGNASVSDDDVNTPGSGGSGGAAGEAGEVRVVDLTNPSGSFTITVGAAGVAADGALAIGGRGGASTVVANGVTYTSAGGGIPSEGYRDILNGVTYAVSGRGGISGGNGGTYGTKGQNVSYSGTTYQGGAAGQRLTNDHGIGGGGGGGGAAYGSAGGAGADGYEERNEQTYRLHWRGGAGGTGANASQIPYTPQYGSGGIGGCGGGGGGCVGNWADDRWSRSSGWGYSKLSGVGGSFSKGGNGGKGFVLIYY